jgi:flagellar biosynthetic protein FlhB
VAHDDKTEAPTPKRKREARQEGRIPRSAELGTWSALLLATFIVPMAIGHASAGVLDLFERALALMAAPDAGAAVGLVGAGARTTLLGTAPIAAAMLLCGVGVNLAQTGLVLSAKKLKPKAERLNPLAGLKRLFSPESAWNGAKVLLRTAVLAVVAWMPLRRTAAELTALDRPPMAELVAATGETAVVVVRLVAAVGLLLGVLDYALSRRRTMKGMRMTKQEVRDENRNSEGDPMVRHHIRQRQREMSRNRMIAAVADASVVVVNPTHVAVALRYTPGQGAPVLVARGKGEVATRIRAEAERHRVPMVRDVPLAWALHDTGTLDRPIPAELFEAVARVLAFVLTVGRRAAVLGGAVSLNRASAAPIPPPAARTAAA